jgi:hypothetical protein
MWFIGGRVDVESTGCIRVDHGEFVLKCVGYRRTYCFGSNQYHHAGIKFTNIFYDYNPEESGVL